MVHFCHGSVSVVLSSLGDDIDMSVHRRVANATPALTPHGLPEIVPVLHM